MAGTITRLQFQQHTADRVNVYLDGQFAFGLPALEAAHLRVNQFLTDAEIERLLAADLVQQAYDRAVRFLSVRPRSRAEVRRHLTLTATNAANKIADDAAASAAAEAVVEAVIEKLTQQGYLNDGDFARFWVDNRQQFRPKGSRALRQELRQRGLDSETIDAALADIDPSAGAYRAAQHQARRLAGLVKTDPAMFRRKLGDFLARRGYDYEIVRDVLARLAAELGAEDVPDDN